MTDPNAGPTGGARIGTRIAGIVGRAIAVTKTDTARASADLGATVLEEFFNLVSSEIRGTTGPILGPLADHPLTPDPLKNVLHFMARGNGQWQTFLTQSVIGGAMSTGIGALLNNYLGPVIQDIIKEAPAGLLDAASAATAEARGITDGYDNAGEAARGGIDGARFRKLVELNTRHPDPGTLLDAMRRGTIGEDTVRQLLRAQGIDIRDLQIYIDTATELLTPQELATLVNFGVLTEAEATPLAAKAGMTADPFHMLVVGGGQPPALGTLLEAYRRGIIDDARLAKGIQQGPTRIEWTDVLKALRYEPMPTADAITAAVQGHLTVDQARAKAQENGLLPEDFDPLMATAGEAPGPQTVLDFMNRGIFTPDEAVAAIKETRLKDKYIPALLASAVNLPPNDTVRMLYRTKQLDRTEAYGYLRQLGYDDRISNALLDSATASRSGTARDLTAAQVTGLYSERAIDADTAGAMLSALGYTDDDVTFLLDGAELARLKKFNDAAISKVASQFVSHHIDVNTASAALDALQIPASQRDDLLNLWSIESAIVTKSLTEAQIVAAAKKAIIDPDTAESLLIGQGYAQADADVLLATAGIQTTAMQAQTQGG